MLFLIKEESKNLVVESLLLTYFLSFNKIFIFNMKKILKIIIITKEIIKKNPLYLSLYISLSMASINSLIAIAMPIYM